MVVRSAELPLKRKEDGCAATCSSSILDKALSSSSDKPSEKYSCAGSPLMFTYGRTATEWGGGEKALVCAACRNAPLWMSQPSRARTTKVANREMPTLTNRLTIVVAPPPAPA